ncbi:MAG TPA: hypothetical protein DHD79_10230 [Firmicutes bacterium]|nr:hypothetical protein [Bacillota bacterium]HAW69844.1 hypothetical protein [Bacillota bacterium]HAZ21420.1 hypothetical protein [Bacillota bacterium]HBE05823.1 hypothetical protein [Bacillota bacterium]HBG43167.1 hypothetical protein [Bacillota bacterium]
MAFGNADKHGEKMNIFKNVRFIKIVCSCSVLLTTGVVFLRLIAAVIPSIQTMIIAGLLDALPRSLPNRQFAGVLGPLVALFAILLSSYLVQALNRFLMLKLSMRLEDHFKPEFVGKISRLSYEHIENDATYDLLERAGTDLPESIGSGFVNLMDLAEISLRILGPVLIIARSSAPVAVICLLLMIPIAILAQKSGTEAYQATAQIAPHARKAKYLQSLMSSREATAERKLFGYAAKINGYWNNEMRQKIALDYAADRKIFIRAKGISILFTALLLLITLIMIMIVRQGLMTAGTCISLFITFSQLVHVLSWQLSDLLKEYTNKRLYLEDLDHFRQLAEKPASDGIPDRAILDMPFESLIFDHVSFTYPQTEREILHDFCLNIFPGKQYAFVGRNGCGKSTVIKLLTGLYDNYCGRILLNGRDIKSYSAAEIKAYLAVVYQDFAKYQLSAKEALRLGNQDLGEQELVVLLEQTGLARKVESFTNGIETPLGKLESGSMELSEGQWQRLALARCFGRGARLLVLDEPAAALDALAESKIYQVIRNIGARRHTCTLYVTHRLSAARTADEIIVMEDGRVIGQGTHQTLLTQNAHYAEMFHTQQKWYLKKEAAEA